MWAIMKAYNFSALAADGIRCAAPLGGPQRFIPVFDTKEQAVKFADGDETHIVECEERDAVPSNPPQIPSSLPGRLNANAKVKKRYVRK
jgi:hypothetical protein